MSDSKKMGSNPHLRVPDNSVLWPSGTAVPAQFGMIEPVSF